MNYQNIYTQIIERSVGRVLDCYTENHHITPVCMGGGNEKENIAVLTAREHYLCHWLLFKIHRTTKLAYAWNAMCIGYGENRYTSRTFAYARYEWSKRISESNCGKIFSEETRKKMSIAKADHIPWNKGLKVPRENTAKIEYEKNPKLCIFCGASIRYKMRLIRKYCSNACAHLDPNKKKVGGAKKGGNSGSFNRGFRHSKESMNAISKALTGLRRPRVCCIICNKEGSASHFKKFNHYEKCEAANGVHS